MVFYENNILQLNGKVYRPLSLYTYIILKKYQINTESYLDVDTNINILPILI